MKNNGIIFLVEDDKDDIEIFSSIVTECFPAHELKVFTTLEPVFEYLSGHSEKPFLILCDNNWRNKNQKKFVSLKIKYPDIKLKSIPFIFFSSLPECDLINEAFEDLNVQGYFQKQTSYEEIKKDMNSIITYWERSVTP